MISGIFSRFLLHIYGTIRSAIYTYKALNLRLMDESKAWSKFWIVYAFMASLESMLECFQPSQWLPLYEEFKFIVTLCIVIGAPNSSVWIFNNIVDPLLSMPQVNEFISHGVEFFYSSVVLTILWIIHWIRVTAMPVVFNLLLKGLCLLPGFHIIKKLWKKKMSCVEKPATGEKPNHPKDTEEEYKEANEFSLSPNNRNAASHLSFRHCPSVAQMRRKFGDVLNDEPRKFHEEVNSMYRDSNSEDTTIFTAKDIRRREKRFSLKSKNILAP